jgi:rod shape-determining protein MreC
VVVYRQGRRRRISLVLIVVTSLALISLDQSGAGVVSTARTAAQNIISPIQNLADDAINPVTNFFDSLGRADELEAENAQLRRKLAAAEGAVAEGQDATRQLQEIQGLLDLPQIADYDGIVASVVDGPVDNFSRTLQLDKGSDSGIAVDMPVVVTGGALIGRVVQVSKTRSTVMRLDDPQFGVAVQLQPPDRVGPKGVARGQRSSTLLTLQTLESKEALTKGELAVTQGSANSLFPKGLLVGTVTRNVDVASATQQQAQLKPVADLDRLDLVKVLRYSPPPTP